MLGWACFERERIEQRLKLGHGKRAIGLTASLALLAFVRPELLGGPTCSSMPSSRLKQKDAAMTDVKRALVTNARDFAGPAAVTSLLAAGFQVAAHDRGFTNDGVRAEFQRRYPEALLSGEPEPEALVEAVWSGVGPLEVVVSNDHHPARHADVEAADVGDLQTTLDMLVVRPFRLVKAVVPRFRALNRGRIVMVTSCRTKLPVAGGAIPDAASGRANTRLMHRSKQSLHSITSSAVARRVCGTVRPSALAALRLMASSNLVGCRIGRSAGFSPLRMRPT